MTLLNCLAFYYRATPWARYLAETAADELLGTDITRMPAAEICNLADLVAANNVDRTMTPAMLRGLLLGAAKALSA